MVEKKKGGKKKIIRHEALHTAPEPSKKPPLVEKTPLSTRLKENNPGFGILKGVAAFIALLIVGSAILFNRAGGREALRGDKTEGEACEETVECKTGFICFAYKEDRHRCMKTCSSKHSCEPGYTCLSAASSKRKGIRVTEICVRDAAR